MSNWVPWKAVISWLDEWLSASQEGLRSMELVSQSSFHESSLLSNAASDVGDRQDQPERYGKLDSRTGLQFWPNDWPGFKDV
jgi:hypothetical protein